jgi:hypothetical protein
MVSQSERHPYGILFSGFCYQERRERRPRGGGGRVSSPHTHTQTSFLLCLSLFYVDIKENTREEEKSFEVLSFLLCPS